jgi:acetyl esterase
MKKLILIFIGILSFLISGTCQKTELVLYKQIDTVKLHLEVHYAQNLKEGTKAPAMVFFFGGGWVGGGRSHFLHHAKYFASRGITCFLADYRTFKKHETPPFECVKDAKAAMRYVRKNAEKFNIDPEKIIASGGSAGGHLATSMAFIDKYNHEDDDLSVNCQPAALVLFNPVYDNGPGGYGYKRIGDNYKDFSPLHNIDSAAPPTIVFLGTEDSLIPVETAEYFKTVMERIGARCDLHLYEDQPHGFFNHGRENNKYYYLTVYEVDKFLVSLGYIEGEPTIKP